MYTGDTVDALTEVASDEDRGGFLTSAVSFNTVAGEWYRIAVDGLNGAAGNVVLQWNFLTTTNRLPQITVQPVSQTIVLSNLVVFQVELANSTDPALSYQWLFNGLPIPNAITNRLVITNADALKVGKYSVKISQGSYYVESPVADLQFNQTGDEIEDVRAYNKLVHLIRSGKPLRLGGAGLFGFAPALASGKGGTRGFTVSRGYSGSQVFSTAGASKEPGEPNHCGEAGGASHWFAYLAEANGALYLNTDGSDFDTVLAVYTGGDTFESLIPVACDNDGGMDGFDSAVMFDVTPGTVYYFAVDGVGGASGVVHLNYRLATPSQLTPLGAGPSGENQLRLTGQPEGQFAVQYSTDLQTWNTWLITNTPMGMLDLVHPGSTNFSPCFYRSVTLP